MYDNLLQDRIRRNLTSFERYGYLGTVLHLKTRCFRHTPEKQYQTKHYENHSNRISDSGIAYVLL